MRRFPIAKVIILGAIAVLLFSFLLYSDLVLEALKNNNGFGSVFYEPKFKEFRFHVFGTMIFLTVLLIIGLIYNKTHVDNK